MVKTFSLSHVKLEDVLHTNYHLTLYHACSSHDKCFFIKNVNIMICDNDMNEKLPNKLVTEHN